MGDNSLGLIALFLFVVFVTMKGNLARYLRVLFG